MAPLHSIPWTAICMGNCEFHSPTDGSRERGIVEWHAEAATLFITMENREEIYLEMDNEIFDVKYEKFDDSSTATITMRIEKSRPLLWADGTGFDPYYDDRNMLGIKLDVKSKERGSLYEELVQWIVANVPHDCIEVSSRQALLQWNNLASAANSLSVDEDAGLTTTNKVFVLMDKHGQLTKEDLERLEPGRWANDTLVEWYSSYFSELAAKAHPERKFFVINSNFYSTYLESPERVVAWATPDIFRQELLVFMINLNSTHWVTVVVHRPGVCVSQRSEGEPDIVNDNASGEEANASGEEAKASQDSGEEANEGEEDDEIDMTSIYILDSVHGGHPPTLATTIKAYLERKCRSQGTLKFHPKKIMVETATVPQQPNSHDCGYYMLYFAELFITQPGKCLANIKSGMKKKLKTAWGDPAVQRKKVKNAVTAAVKKYREDKTVELD